MDTNLMVRSVAIPHTQYIFIEANAQDRTTYVITIIKLVPHQSKNLDFAKVENGTIHDAFLDKTRFLIFINKTVLYSCPSKRRPLLGTLATNQLCPYESKEWQSNRKLRFFKKWKAMSGQTIRK